MTGTTSPGRPTLTPSRRAWSSCSALRWVATTSASWTPFRSSPRFARQTPLSRATCRWPECSTPRSWSQPSVRAAYRPQLVAPSHAHASRVHFLCCRRQIRVAQRGLRPARRLLVHLVLCPRHPPLDHAHARSSSPFPASHPPANMPRPHCLQRRWCRRPHAVTQACDTTDADTRA